MRESLAKAGRTLLGQERYLNLRERRYADLMEALKQAQFRMRLVTAPLRMLPSYLIIGVPKGGTTSLYRYLIQHPNIGAGFDKVTQFFSRHVGDGLNYYRAHFPLIFQPLAPNGKLIAGEASQDYFIHPTAAQEAARTLPNVKLIVLLRDPIKRAYSHYYFNRWYDGKETLDTFEDAIAHEQTLWPRLDRMNQQEVQAVARLLYLKTGHYAEHLERWFNLFPREQFLILPSESMFSEPEQAVNKVLSFLDLAPMPPRGIDYQASNSGRKNPPINPDTQAYLEEHFHPHNERLYELLGRDFGWH